MNIYVNPSYNTLVDTGGKLNVHKTFRRRPGRLLKVLCTFNLRPVSTGAEIHLGHCQTSMIEILGKELTAKVVN